MSEYLRPHQQNAILETDKHDRCLINMWCGTGKTRTFTMDIFIKNKHINVIVFPSLGLINQYCNDYALNTEEPFKSEFERYDCLAFCSDDDGKLTKKDTILFTTNEKTLKKFFKRENKKIIMVTYQSFEKFVDVCIHEQITINQMIFDEAHHVVGDKIQNIVFNNKELDAIVKKTHYYTATPVNKNGITMYDRDDPENSDCGVLAYEYLYYQAVEDGICKSFETQITLYTQKPEYKNKYQPIFETIIRACLSGKYDYWNILTYHSFVEESDTQNDMISFVTDFASPKNEKVLKDIFIKIQDEEFPETKELYKVNNVILRGVSSKTKVREKIIKEFDRKVKGRISILASCGILNEGIDTTWANMCVPINASNSIVKETQRIGRLVRIPEKNMSPAIILIPCQVDITKYSSMDTPEQRDKMIREELSECGNFNTALNVISAFNYQYDPDIFELCLRYPSMYSPNEVNTNLEKQGLRVEESKGTLIDNLNYLYDEEIEVNAETTDRQILNDVAQQCEKTIEIHTQDYDNPIRYINEEAPDEQPLRLFYCEDDDTYSPIVEKEKKIPRKKTNAPKKRRKLFNVHTHPDLDILWKISEDSIDLTKTFSQGILEVDINYNEKKWNENYTLLVKYNNTPTQSYVTPDGIRLGLWCANRRQDKKKSKLSQEQIELLEKIPNWYWEIDLDEQWNIKYKLLEEYDDMPSRSCITSCGFNLGSWCQKQRSNKKEDKLTQKQIELLEKIPNWYWEQDLDEQWNKKYRLLEEYNDTPVVKYVTKCGIKLGLWCQIQRNNKKEGTISIKRITLLENIPNWYWDKSDEQWYKNYKLLREYNDTPSTTYITNDDIQLGTWCNKQRQDKKKNTLSQEQIELLDKIPNWFWEQDLDEQWNINYKLLEEYNDTPCQSYITEEGIQLGVWCNYQRTNKRKCKLSQQKIELLEKIPNWEWDELRDNKWNKKYELLKEYNDTPITTYVTNCDVKLGSWCVIQRTNKKKGKLSPTQIELLEKIPNWYWDKKDMSKPDIRPKTISKGRPQVQSVMSLLHKEYKTKTSQNLHHYFKEQPQKWEEYHTISKENERTFPAEEIPRNKMIQYLEHLRGKKDKVVADLGCGFAEINKYFKDNARFEFYNFDHHSENDLVVSRDIKDTQLDDYSVDIAILSLAMWGSNCSEYISEAYRILDTGGTLLIAEPYKRWNDTLDEHGVAINRLVRLLEENHFTIVNKDEKKFMFIECRKH